MATLDHTGLNRYIYMTASVETMTLGSHDLSEVKNNDSTSILGSNLDDSRLLLGINLYKNGPYGHPSWKQTRISENPLSRHLRKNNQYPIVGNPRSRVVFHNGVRRVLPERFGKQFVLDEPAVISSYKPIVLVGKVDDYNEKGAPFAQMFTKKISLDNNSSYFSNKIINTISGLITLGGKKSSDETYEILKKYYLEEGLDSPDSPMSSFNSLIYSQTIFPAQKYTYKSYKRSRPTFSFDWRDDLEDRIKPESPFGAFITLRGQSANRFDAVVVQSLWPLDVATVWKDRRLPISHHLGYFTKSEGTTHYFQNTNTASFGILQNPYSQYAHELDNTPTASQDVDNRLRTAPYYNRRHDSACKFSVQSPTGLGLETNEMGIDTIFGGEAFWDAPSQAGKGPFYDTYGKFSEEITIKGKDYSTVAEYRMSPAVQHLLKFNVTGAVIDMPGGKRLGDPASTFSTSSHKYDGVIPLDNEFFEVYTNSDFLENFDVVLKDHEDFTKPSRITIKCKAILKFLPYNGFYPAQRAESLARQFYHSYHDFVDSTLATVEGRQAKQPFQNLLGPLFAPGTLFNSIKAGVACDYPIITGSLVVEQSTTSQTYLFGNSYFSRRIPFEALVEPEKHLAGYELICNEPHPSGNVESTLVWDGGGDTLYSKMANNFLAEIPNFFLKDSSFTTLASLPESDPNFGQVNEVKTYAMRVKMYRSMDGPNLFVTNSNGIKYQTPQDIATGQRETITMYSRPSSFGPACAGYTTGGVGDSPTLQKFVIPDTAEHSLAASSSAQKVYIRAMEGYNFPFTPPYYHGQSWADIRFRPQEKRKYSISEIIASSSVEYIRFDETPYMGNAVINNGSSVGPQRLDTCNRNAMQLDASLNIFSKGKLKNARNENNLEVQINDQSKTRWIIQTKFETPILNFKDYKSRSTRTLPSDNSKASCPVGMWHQYGREPTDEEGIFLQVTEIPDSWTSGQMGRNLHLGALFYDNQRTGSLADLCGFSSVPVKLGQAQRSKKISECVVAIPFISERGTKRFFKLHEDAVEKALNREGGQSVIDIRLLINKLKRFVFPPQFDFLNFPQIADPIAMYAFEFSTKLNRKDLTDIWQNIMPEISVKFQTAESTISHSLLGDEKMINNNNLREDIRWLVFKVKQRAETRYFDQVYSRKGDKNIISNFAGVESDAVGPISKIQYNWPYDFFSLVELIKIDASVQFSDIETDDSGKEVVKDKVAKQENRMRQLNTLFPKDKK